jgi:hypothetical protein
MAAKMVPPATYRYKYPPLMTAVRKRPAEGPTSPVSGKPHGLARVAAVKIGGRRSRGMG